MADAVTVSLSLVKEVVIFLNQELDRYEKVKIDVERIETHLSEMRAFVQDGEEGCEEKQAMKALVDRIRKVAHDMEDVLDDYMIHAPRSLSTSSTFIQTYEFGHHFKHWLPVHKIQSRIAGIQASMSSINTDPLFINTLADVNSRQPPEAATSSQPCFVEDEFEIVGIDAVKAKLEALIRNQGDGCGTISVVGPSGAGKTVLVKTVFKSKRVMSQFDCHAWLSSPHSLDKDLCIQRLLSQFTGSRSTRINLENYLGGKRFMLVIDGVRKLDEWVVIKQALASACSSSSGSRIIITTQNNDIASRCSPRVLHVEGLDWKTSWKLFCSKAFGNQIGDCPPHLRLLSEAIVTRCEYLPQPISVVGDHLSRRPQEQAEWKRVGDNIVVTTHGMNRMFLPSYSHLPTNQRSCLLYFGIFPEDCSVKRERLIRLWLSEGFVENEDQAVDTLNELISRNLVHSSSRDFKGRVKSCRVLDLMRQFVCQKSMENRFARVISEATGNQHLREESRLEHRRLSIENAFSCSNRIQGLKLHSVRSLFMMFGLHNGVASPSKIVQETLNKMKRLKVLDLENAPLSSFPESLGDFTPLLRYLSLRNTQVSVIPEDIKKLRYLEFLDLKQTQVSKLPGEIFSLKYLRHLLVYRFNPIKNDNFEKLQGVEIVGEIRMHPSYIRKLSLIRVQPSPRFFQTVKQLTQLKKLGLCGLKENDGPSLCECINGMPHLSTLDLTSSNREENLDLRSLYVKPPNRMEVETTLDVQILEHLYLKGRLRIFPEWFSSLNSLSKLILRGSRLNSINAFEVLQKLPNLIELEMNDAFTAEVLIVDTGGFPKLRTLHIEQFDSLTAMVAHNGSMPMVEKLTLVRCMRLHELPFGIDGLKCLEKLMLYDMPAQFITRLHKSSEDHSLVSHIPVIHSFYVTKDNTWQVCNFSSRHTSRLFETRNCPKLETLSDRKLPDSLEELIVDDCPPLQQRLVEGGEDWHKIEHVLNKSISEVDEDEWIKGSKDDDTGGLLSDEDREADREATEKIANTIEERLRNRPLPPPPPLPLKLDVKKDPSELQDTDVLREVSVVGESGDPCSIFLLLPEDYEIEKGKLIQLWMAGEWINDEQHGDELFSSFFQTGYLSHCSSNLKTGKARYKIVAQKIKALRDRQKGNAESIRHVSLGCNAEIDAKTFKAIEMFTQLRTLLFLGNCDHGAIQIPRHLFSVFNHLATLDLSGTRMKELPSSIEHIRGLRYLDLSWTLIEWLPNILCTLVQLQTLKLSGCYNLTVLPENLHQLTKLRHLDFDVLGQLETMPPKMGELVDLRTLPAFLVGTGDGRKITELNKVNSLSGELCIANLENVENGDEAKAAALTYKEHLKTLELRWTSSEICGMHDNSEDILDQLEPSTKLEELKITCYEGEYFPGWIEDPDYYNLTSIVLYRCENLSYVPVVEQLPNLKHLRLVRMNGVKEIVNEQEQRNYAAFPNLEKLEINEMLSLENWDWKKSNEGDFSSLSHLIIEDCPELARFDVVSHLPSIRLFEIRNCPKLETLSDRKLPDSLEELIVDDCPPLQQRLVEGGEDWHKIEHVLNKSISEVDEDEWITDTSD